MWSDILSNSEAEFTQRAIESLNNVDWARPVIDRLQKAGGLKSANMPLMFEVRFAYELHRVGKSAEYEYRAGEGDSTVDFRIPGNITWLIELVSIRASQAAKRAIKQMGLIYQQILSSDAKDVDQTEEAEMITAEQKIGEKVFAKESPTKFPMLKDDVYHMIIIDMRGYLGGGGDQWDYTQMAYGASGIPPQCPWYLRFWEKEPGKLEPIKGLFEKACPLQSARLVQERIHFLGFIRERVYCEGEIPKSSCYFLNQHLLSNEAAEKAFETFPLKFIRTQ